MILGNKDKIILAYEDKKIIQNHHIFIQLPNHSRRFKKSIYVVSKYTYSIINFPLEVKYAYKIIPISFSTGLNSQLEIDLKKDFYNENEVIVSVQTENKMYLKNNKTSFFFNAYRPGLYSFIVKTNYRTYFIFVAVKEEKNKIQRG